ncbi:MAG: bifunctional oligoribonuclease/PAP phosphatase NrnA, partial [Verrucomicrobiae bacterium]|nr:bifunctional oligoribonuclease/PAP phosphatase NrnA [Verrucomicrobiae bacterium]
SLTLHFDNRVCLGLLENGVYDEVGAKIEDSEGLVDYARSIDGVDIGVLVEERNGKIKGSLRAKEAKYRCDEIAKRFHGGGHAAAAGLNYDSDLESFVPQLLQAIGEQLEKVDSLS